MEILKHRLVDGGVQHLVCRKNSRKLSGPDMIVVHYTAGSSARTAAEFLAKEEVKASAHLVIGRQGELFQLVPFDTEAWHAGRSSYDGRANLNRYSIGIELDNLGRLQLQEGRFAAECCPLAVSWRSAAWKSLRRMFMSTIRVKWRLSGIVIQNGRKGCSGKYAGY